MELPESSQPGGTIFFLGRDIAIGSLAFNVLSRESISPEAHYAKTNIDAVNTQLTAKGQGIILWLSP